MFDPARLVFIDENLRNLLDQAIAFHDSAWGAQLLDGRYRHFPTRLVGMQVSNDASFTKGEQWVDPRRRIQPWAHHIPPKLGKLGQNQAVGANAYNRATLTATDTFREIADYCEGDALHTY
jgi:hypothetical protein